MTCELAYIGLAVFYVMVGALIVWVLWLLILWAFEAVATWLHR